MYKPVRRTGFQVSFIRSRIGWAWGGYGLRLKLSALLFLHKYPPPPPPPKNLGRGRAASCRSAVMHKPPFKTQGLNNVLNPYTQARRN